jgi:uncharacterized damage-inducible protein DinB
VQDQERQAHLETLKQTPGRLKELLRGVPRAVLSWAPAPGKWSILEIACHLRDMERDAYLARYRRILAEDNPALPDIDGDVYALERAYSEQRLSDVLRDWKRLRKECLGVLRTVKGDQWARQGTHPTAGALSIADFLRRQAVGNDQAHLGQIEAIKSRHALLARLQAAPGELAQATRGASDEALRRRTAEGKWSMLENACHLRDIEQVFAERFSKMAFGERPQLWMMDNQRVAESRRYAQADLGAVLKEFRRRRALTVGLLQALPQAHWGRTGLHPKRGELTIEQMARHLADHDRNHLDRIRGLRG